jgi:dolichol-phosphate mannosyltransferase
MPAGEWPLFPCIGAVPATWVVGRFSRLKRQIGFAASIFPTPKYGERVISVVTPVYNEIQNLSELINRLEAVFRQGGTDSWELVVVDDGSMDGTREFLMGLQTSISVQIVILSRNFGQQSALMAGLSHAKGDAVIFIDGDLQDPPEVIPELVRKWEQGADVVFAVRSSRKESIPRRLAIRGFHKVFGAITGKLMPEDSGNFGLVSSRVAAILCNMGEHNLYLPALRAWTGFRQEVVSYARENRARGEALSLLRLFGFGWDVIVSFSEVPLRLISALGALISLMSFAYGSVLVVQRILQFFGYFRGLEVLGFTTVAVSVFFMGGIQLICLGVIAEYLARIYRELKGRPRYLVDEVVVKNPTPQELKG